MGSIVVYAHSGLHPPEPSWRAHYEKASQKTNSRFCKAFRLLNVCLQGIYQIFLLDLTDSVHHGGEDDQEDTHDGDDDGVPWEQEAGFPPVIDDQIQPKADQDRYGQPPAQGFRAIHQAFIAHHSVEALLCHSYGAKHGEVLASERHIRRNGIEHVRDRDQSDQDDKAI